MRAAPITRPRTRSSEFYHSSRSEPGSSWRCPGRPGLPPELGRLVSFLAPGDRSRSPVGRAVARSFTRRSGAYVQARVIVGAGDIGQLVARKILQHPEYGIDARRLRRRRAARAAARDRRRRRCSAGSTSSPTLVERARRRARHRRVLGRARRARRWRSSGRCATATCSRHRAAAVRARRAERRASTRSRACRSSASRRRGSRARRSLIKRVVDVVGAAFVLAADRAALRVSPRSGSSVDSPGPGLLPPDAARASNSGRSRALKFRTMSVGHRRRTSTASTSEQHDETPTRRSNGERALQARARRRRHRVRPLAAQDEPRRAAAADQRAARRHVARRPAAVHPVRDRALRAAPLRALPRARRASPASGR